MYPEYVVTTDKTLAIGSKKVLYNSSFACGKVSIRYLMDVYLKGDCHEEKYTTCFNR